MFFWPSWKMLLFLVLSMVFCAMAEGQEKDGKVCKYGKTLLLFRKIITKYKIIFPLGCKPILGFWFFSECVQHCKVRVKIWIFEFLKTKISQILLYLLKTFSDSKTSPVTLGAIQMAPATPKKSAQTRVEMKKVLNFLNKFFEWLIHQILQRVYVFHIFV